MTLFQSFRDYLGRTYPAAQIQINPETSIGFSSENLNYSFVYTAEEPTYFRLILPRVAVPDDIPFDRLCRIACEVSYGYKVGKIVVSNSEFWICYEQLLNPEANNDSVYGFSIRVLHSMIVRFRERMEQERAATHQNES